MPLSIVLKDLRDKLSHKYNLSNKHVRKETWKMFKELKETMEQTE